MIRDKAEQIGYKLLIAVLVALLLAWLPMIAFGILHDRFPAMPAFGYVECVLLLSTWNVLRGGSTTGQKS